jgi:hypothetical protein
MMTDQSTEKLSARYPKTIKIKLILLSGILILPCFLSATDHPINELPIHGGNHYSRVEEDRKILEFAKRTAAGQRTVLRLVKILGLNLSPDL